MTKKLYRSREHKMLGGVCGGLADYFNIDPVITRLAYLLITAASNGFGILVYIIAWIVIPLSNEKPTEEKKEPIHVVIHEVKKEEEKGEPA
jgi:phage shock protein C